ncbi:S41 family peptidase [Deinococcus yavapaiensis]|uniref:PDZ domain-containing protein n=1 Tax=Deinococcus yavapaiensis KR-236 TaxID=694435 RepID=A0A318SDE6_9DEIO|nr:PDZ domain-containing protein [Deinococcus yavapaiensis]PYE50408.1 PDZ domain-containing protein [Deinococcus yavapaiensis KR-236]
MNWRTITWLALPMLFAATSQAVPVSGLFRGTIVDWPAGQVGEIRLESVDAPNVVRGTIDAQGHFSLMLPAADRLKKMLAPLSGLFANPSNYDKGCSGQGTAVPANAGYKQFNLNVYQNGKLLGDLQLNSTAQLPMPVGSQAAHLRFQDMPVTMKGTVSCPSYVDQIDVQGKAGWDLVLVTHGGLSESGLEQSTYTGDPLPKELAWRLFSEFGGTGFRLERHDTAFLVTEVLPDQPAQKAGLRSGDIIERVNGVDVNGLTLPQLIGVIRGAPGTTVTLGVSRAGVSGLVQLPVVRALVRMP